jgi:hypothetical protein
MPDIVFGQVYISRVGGDDAGNDREVFFMVLKPPLVGLDQLLVELES